MIKIEEKLFQNRYRVDEGHPHIHIINPEVCADNCSAQSCTYVCPAGCYVADEKGDITLTTDGCLECGTCRIICNDHHNVAWEYPRGGHGILFKFG
ncbi:ferredoxin family protein [Acidithiobacillus ferrooxidans F221]|uniref:ferredoxin family protein n=1 Tax=Acidithiobacillus ferrooxidans TaxID=920 RepID=UPI001C06FC1E|nr:ferredoxin family protein [Acidithiobacillus ferrooxidans]MBU2809486.1 ferredoxin family protein [Acidithiobacillus ferrooxidans F221]